jgi:cytidylate kinase
MAVVTISSEPGSGGREIAQLVAPALSYVLVDKRTTDDILRQYGLTKFEDLYSTAPSFLDLLNADNLLLVSMANEILEAVASRDKAVILGRTGFAVLGAYANVLHVRITAPLAERAQRVMIREGLADLQTAEDRVKEDDDIHRTYVQRFYDKHWDDPSSYNLSLDTGSLSIDVAAQQVVAATRALEQKGAAAGAATTSQIQVDPVLADAISKVME